jgi:hypothetical protein
MADNKETIDEKKELDQSEVKNQEKQQETATPQPPVQQQPPAGPPRQLPQQPSAGPITPEELQKNAEEEDRKTMRVLQVIQHIGNQRIEVHPVQNVNLRSDIVGLLTQALNNIQNEDMMRNDAALLKEAVAMIKKEEKGKEEENKG